MTLPITNLPDTTVWNTRNATGDYYSIRQFRTKQKAPFNLPTRFHRRKGVTERLDVTGNTAYATKPSAPDSTGTYGIRSDFNTYLTTNAVSWANNSAYDKFRDKVSEEAMLFVNWHERESAIEAAIKRFSQLYLFTRAIRKRSPRQAAMALGVDPRRVPRGTWKRTKTAAQGLGNTWLEWHFGWDPLIKDIASTVNILNQQPNQKRVSVRGKAIKEVLFEQHTSAAYDYIDITRKVKVRTTVTALIGVKNPNVHMADQLGLLNPLAIAWELVPYSFVVDWFANVGTYLQSYTDFSGLTITGATTSQVGRIDYEYKSMSRSVAWTGPWLGTCTALQVGTWYTRSLGIPSVKLGIRPLKRVSAVRGFTAISLLLNQMRK